MRNYLLIFLGFLPAYGFSQVFHFNDTSTVLQKDITQSPAHWYIEIINDAGVDTTLRWKSFFTSVPSQWSVNFDTQGGYTPVVLDGDSADFTLLAQPPFNLQKLIIGVDLNNTTARATIAFQIYEPNDPANKQTIAYFMEVGAASLPKTASQSIFTIYQNILSLSHEVAPSTVSLYDLSGQEIPVHQLSATKWILPELKGKAVLLRIQNQDSFSNFQLSY